LSRHPTTLRSVFGTEISDISTLRREANSSDNPSYLPNVATTSSDGKPSAKVIGQYGFRDRRLRDGDSALTVNLEGLPHIVCNEVFKAHY
jgi:hypothetical protein